MTTSRSGSSDYRPPIGRDRSAMSGPVVVALVWGAIANACAMAALLVLALDGSWWLVGALLAATATSSVGAWRAITALGVPQSDMLERGSFNHGHGGDVTDGVDSPHSVTTAEVDSTVMAPGSDGAEILDNSDRDG